MTQPHSSRSRDGDPFIDSAHDHDSCVADALLAAARLCSEQSKRLTPLRRRVLELVWDSHEPVGAYALLQRMGEERGRIAPPTIYRALEFLVAMGLVHRIESLSAFVGCAHPEHGHKAYFMICSDCGSAAEIADGALPRTIAQVADKAGFCLLRETVELSGTCARCTSTS